MDGPFRAGIDVRLGDEPTDRGETDFLIGDQDLETADSEQRIGTARRHVAGCYCRAGRRATAVRYFLCTNGPMCSFRNSRSAGLLAAPAVCPHSDGIGVKVTPRMNACSYRASVIGKYRSVSDGM